MSRAKYRSRKPVDDVDDYEDEADAQITLIGRPLPGESSGSHGGSTMIRPPKQDKFAELRAGVVTDSRGNQRFHGAFTGGFSAGYFNSVGTIAGFKPTAFVSSRARRADSSALRAEDYMDEEDRAESAEAGKTLVAKSEFDTFGATENELTRKRSAAVGKALASLIVPASDSVGVKLLKKMGWREGEPIAAKADPAAPQRKIATVSMPPHMLNRSNNEPSSDDEANPRSFDAYVARVERQKQSVASEDAGEYEVRNKQDSYGLGFDAARAAGPEVTQMRALHQQRDQHAQSSRSNKYKLMDAVSGTTSAGDEYDIDGGGEMGYTHSNDYDIELDMPAPPKSVRAKALTMSSLHDDDEDDSIAVKMFRDIHSDKPSALSASKRCADGTLPLPGFTLGDMPSLPPRMFVAPVVPSDFNAQHRFDATDIDLTPTLRRMTVAQGGYKPGADLNALPARFGRAQMELQQQHQQQQQQQQRQQFPHGTSRAADERGKILGETQLPATHKNHAMITDAISAAKAAAAKSQSSLQNGMIVSAPASAALASKFVVASAEHTSGSQLQAGLYQPSFAAVADVAASQSPEATRAALSHHYGAEPSKAARFQAFLDDRAAELLQLQRRAETAGQSTLAALNAVQQPLQSKHASSAFSEHMTNWQMQAEVNEFSETLASSSYGQYLARTTQQAQKTIDEVKARLQQTVALESAGAASDFSAAASARMFGRLTRQTVGWRPARLLCKRFNVAEPYVSDEPPASEHSHQDSHSIRSGHAPPPPPKSSFDEKVKALFASVGLGNAVPAPVPTPAPSAPVNAADDSTPLPPPPRPPIDLFRAIFADSDSDGDEVAPSRAPMASSVVPPAARPSVPTALPLADLKPTQPHSTPQSSAPQHPVASQSASARPQHDDLLGSIFGKGSVLTLSTDAPTQSANARADRMRDLSGTASTSASKDAALAIASRHTAVLQSQRAGGVAATTSQQSQNNRALEFLSSVLPSGTQAAPAPTMSAVSATGAPALQPTSLEELLRARRQSRHESSDSSDSSSSSSSDSEGDEARRLRRKEKKERRRAKKAERKERKKEKKKEKSHRKDKHEKHDKGDKHKSHKDRD